MAWSLAAAAGRLLEFPGLAVLQNWHPLIVHYPVALLTAAALVYAISALTRREAWAWVALWMLSLGTLSAAVAVWTGLRAGDGVMLAQSVWDHVLDYHRRYMISVFALAVMLSAWALVARPLPRRGRTGFIVAMLLMAAMIAKGADYGGWMVYGYNAGGSLPQPIEFSH